MGEDVLHTIDVEGTRSILQAAVEHGVRQLIVTSSGAAYGYYPENAEWIDEDDPLRGHNKFAYAKHKREVEEVLVRARIAHPQLRQLILRPGTILGKRVNNQITDMFKKKAVMGISGSDSRFVFIWDQDVVSIIIRGLAQGCSGIFNLAGDGALPPGARVLDACAAPGGKAFHLAEFLAPGSEVVAIELHPRKADQLAADGFIAIAPDMLTMLPVARRPDGESDPDPGPRRPLPAAAGRHRLGRLQIGRAHV